MAASSVTQITRSPTVAREADRTAWQHAIFLRRGGERDPYFGRTGVRRGGAAIVPLDRALVSSYKLSIVTMFDRNLQPSIGVSNSVPLFRRHREDRQ